MMLHLAAWTRVVLRSHDYKTKTYPRDMGVLNKCILQWPLSIYDSYNTSGHNGTLVTHSLLGVGLVLLQ